VDARGDLDVDQHHTVEECGITLGEAVQKALGSKRGICARLFWMPMDETLAAAAWILARPYCVVNAKIAAKRVGDFQPELVEVSSRGRAIGKSHVICALSTAALDHLVEGHVQASHAPALAVARDKRCGRFCPHKGTAMKVTD